MTRAWLTTFAATIVFLQLVQAAFPQWTDQPEPPRATRTEPLPDPGIMSKTVREAMYCRSGRAGGPLPDARLLSPFGNIFKTAPNQLNQPVRTVRFLQNGRGGLSVRCVSSTRRKWTPSSKHGSMGPLVSGWEWMPRLAGATRRASSWIRLSHATVDVPWPERR